jgi:hypothetical protein
MHANSRRKRGKAKRDNKFIKNLVIQNNATTHGQLSLPISHSKLNNRVSTFALHFSFFGYKNISKSIKGGN